MDDAVSRPEVMPRRNAKATRCIWHANVFETLIRALADPRASVRERACCAMGAPACVFEVQRTGCAPAHSHAKS